jgi:hypothetical protein
LNLTSSPFAVVILETGSHELFTCVGLQTLILWISASQVARITDVSHQLLAYNVYLNGIYSMELYTGMGT